MTNAGITSCAADTISAVHHSDAPSQKSTITNTATTTAATSDTSEDAANATSPFLDLPPELRNRIYGYTLIQEDITKTSPSTNKPFPYMLINQSNCMQPGILRACRQTRSEASAMYYVENSFFIDTTNFDSKALQIFCRSAGKYWELDADEDDYDKTAYVRIGCGPNDTDQANLEEWLKAFHEGRVEDVRCGRECDPGRIHPCCAASDACVQDGGEYEERRLEYCCACA